MSLNHLAKQCHEVSKSKGWLEETRTFGDLIALMHSELSEALEEFRAGHGFNEIYWLEDKPEGIPIELADCLIRILQFCGTYEVDIDRAYDIKIAYNQTRPHRHGGKKI